MSITIFEFNIKHYPSKIIKTKRPLEVLSTLRAFTYIFVYSFKI